MLSKQERKNRIDQLVSDLAKSTSPEVEWMRELFDLQFEDVKDRLITADATTFAAVQGEARYLEKFSRQLIAASALYSRTS